MVPPLSVFAMRGLLRTLGNLLLLIGALVGTSLFLPPSGASGPQSAPIEVARGPQSTPIEVASIDESPAAAPSPKPTPGPPTLVVRRGVAPTPTPEARLPVTRVVIPAIDLDTEVVEAPLVDKGGERTWLVPAFKAGQAQDTAGAGQRGNAVLMGHVSSIHSGDVFRNLDRVHVGDAVEVFSAERRFAYRVYETRSVPPTDLAMIAPTADAVVSLFTCTGTWDPLAWDFTERLFVRAKLASE